MRFGIEVLEACRERGRRRLHHRHAHVGRRADRGRPDPRGMRRPSPAPMRSAGLIDFVNVLGGAGARPSRPSPSAAEHVVPGGALPVPRQRHQARGRHPDLPRPRITDLRHRRPCRRGRACGHGRDDPRPHRRSAHRPQADGRRGSTTSGNASAPATASTASMPAATRSASRTPPPAASGPCRTSSRKAAGKKRVVVVGGGPGGLEAARVSAERGHSVVLFEKNDRDGRPDQHRRQGDMAGGADRHHPLADQQATKSARRYPPRRRSHPGGDRGREARIS